MCNRLPEIMKNGDAGIFPVYSSLNVSKYSEHLLDQGEKSSKYLGGSIGCKYKTSSRNF